MMDELLPLLEELKSHFELCPRGQVPLLNVAVNRERFDVTEWLLVNGADPNIVSRNGKSCLTYAIRNSSVRMLELLLTHGANPNTVYLVQEGHRKTGNYTGRSPLAWVILASGMSFDMQCALIDLLVNHGADVNIRNEKGTTPLFWCAIENRQDLLDYLIETHHADVALTTYMNETVAERAAHTRHRRLAQHVTTLIEQARAAEDLAQETDAAVEEAAAEMAAVAIAPSTSAAGEDDPSAGGVSASNSAMSVEDGDSKASGPVEAGAAAVEGK